MLLVWKKFEATETNISSAVRKRSNSKKRRQIGEPLVLHNKLFIYGSPYLCTLEYVGIDAEPASRAVIKICACTQETYQS